MRVALCAPQVNAQLAAKLLAAREGARGEPAADAAVPAASSDDGEEEEGGEGGRARKRQRAAASSALLEDERFGAMFTDRAFAIDEKSEEYRLLHPNAGARYKLRFWWLPKKLSVLRFPYCRRLDKYA